MTDYSAMFDNSSPRTTTEVSATPPLPVTDPVFNTAVTRAFGTRIPIVAGGLMWLLNADYVAAGARAGIMSFITAASFPEPDALSREIARCKQLSAGRSFGVNVSMLPKLVEGDQVEDTFELIAKEGIRFVETSGRNPEAYLPMLKAAGITVLHKVPSVRYAIKAQSVGVSRGLLSAGPALGLTNALAPLVDIVDQLERESLDALRRLRPGNNTQSHRAQV